MVVGDGNVVGCIGFSAEADAPLIVDADGMLAFSVSLEGFESVAGWEVDRIEVGHRVELGELSQRDALDARRKIAGFSLAEECFGVFAGERSDHNVMR